MIVEVAKTVAGANRRDKGTLLMGRKIKMKLAKYHISSGLIGEIAVEYIVFKSDFSVKLSLSRTSNSLL